MCVGKRDKGKWEKYLGTEGVLFFRNVFAKINDIFGKKYQIMISKFWKLLPPFQNNSRFDFVHVV